VRSVAKQPGSVWRVPAPRWAFGDVAVILLLALVVAVPNRWMSWETGVRYLQANDVASYEAIARAAPSLPVDKIPGNHAERFAVHYAVGATAKATGIGLHTTYRLAWLICCILIVLVAFRILTGLGLSSASSQLCIAVFMLNAYMFRLYAILPGMLQDLLFVLAVAVVLLALIQRRLWLACLGSVLAVLARQSALPLALATAVWILMGDGWRDRSIANRLLSAGTAVLLTLGIYVAVNLVTEPFSRGIDAVTAPTLQYAPRFPEDTILPTLGAGSSQVGELVEHISRLAGPLLVAAGLLLGGLIVIRLGRHRPSWLPFGFWGSLLFAAFISGQPLVLSPNYVASNASRLSALGLLPLCVAVGFVLRQAEQQGILAYRRWAPVVLLVVLTVASLHRVYTVVGPQSISQFIMVQVAAAALAGWVLLAQRSTRPKQTTEARRLGRSTRGGPGPQG
jgi:general stress protein CsbA